MRRWDLYLFSDTAWECVRWVVNVDQRILAENAMDCGALASCSVSLTEQFCIRASVNMSFLCLKAERYFNAAFSSVPSVSCYGVRLRVK